MGMYAVYCARCVGRGARCVVGMLSATGSRVAHCYSLGLAFACLPGLPARPADSLSLDSVLKLYWRAPFVLAGTLAAPLGVHVYKRAGARARISHYIFVRRKSEEESSRRATRAFTRDERLSRIIFRSFFRINKSHANHTEEFLSSEMLSAAGKAE